MDRLNALKAHCFFERRIFTFGATIVPPWDPFPASGLGDVIPTDVECDKDFQEAEAGYPYAVPFRDALGKEPDYNRDNGVGIRSGAAMQHTEAVDGFLPVVAL